MTLQDLDDQFTYYSKHPPAHLLLAAYVGYEAPLTVEEQHAQGAMNDAEFLEYFKRTGGKIAGLRPH